ncbi:hypothetical protein [Mesorhizobium sp. WSM2561]|uniref:hypothetical protein n=1 Tax=Mesorhizobium sp. WSM2561 TaxID=1040985 RepID=UPI0012EC0D7B|nr:hypothetical protein [Mesorhizobium sp. WSM2561]
MAVSDRKHHPHFQSSPLPGDLLRDCVGLDAGIGEATENAWAQFLGRSRECLRDSRRQAVSKIARRVEMQALVPPIPQFGKPAFLSRTSVGTPAFFSAWAAASPRRAGADHDRTVKNRLLAGLATQFCYFCFHACTCRSRSGHVSDWRDIWSFSGIWQDFAGIRSHMADGIDGDSSRHGPALLPQPVVNH